jgi:hypothetical protein
MNNLVIKNRRYRFIIPIVLVLMFCCGFGYYQYSLNKSNKEYEIKLKNVDKLITEQMKNAKEMIDEYIKQWNFANNGGQILNMDKGGIWIVGTEEIIKNQMEIFEKKGRINSLNINKEIIAKETQQLNNPPIKFKKHYDLVLSMCLNYSEYIKLALSPTGILEEYTDKANNIYAKIENEKEELLIKLP